MTVKTNGLKEIKVNGEIGVNRDDIIRMALEAEFTGFDSKCDRLHHFANRGKPFGNGHVASWYK